MSQEETTVKRGVGRPHKINKEKKEKKEPTRKVGRPCKHPEFERAFTQMQVSSKCAERIRIIAAVHNMTIPVVIDAMVNLHYAELVTQGAVPEDMNFASRIKESTK